MTVMLIVVAPVLERHTYMMLDDSVECFPIRFIISSKTVTVAFKTLTARYNQEGVSTNLASHSRGRQGSSVKTTARGTCQSTHSHV